MATKKAKKTVEAKAPVKEQKKVETVATIKEQKKPDAKNPVKEQKTKAGKHEMVNIFSTTYGWYRYWVKNILAEGGISKFRFVKDADSYNGKISIAKAEVDKAKKVLADYQRRNPDIKTMWQ